MNIEIREYNPSHDYERLMEVIKSEGGEWEEYLASGYQECLRNSVTYVAWMNEILCGYVRSIQDSGMYIWVIDLLVDKRYRGNQIGRKLLERAASDTCALGAFVMSDVDEYYEKQGYRKEGSLYKIEAGANPA